ncbi:hypothetical protein EV359DRAFT_66726 [Lentinula novae-zelandiae]|nr:hypothetical protein EV359DRAFT_66726 [Lentinula novae-zelandiae]
MTYEGAIFDLIILIEVKDSTDEMNADYVVEATVFGKRDCNCQGIMSNTLGKDSIKIEGGKISNFIGSSIMHLQNLYVRLNSRKQLRALGSTSQQRKHPEQALIFALGAFVAGERSPASILALASIHVLQMWITWRNIYDQVPEIILCKNLSSFCCYIHAPEEIDELSHNFLWSKSSIAVAFNVEEHSARGALYITQAASSSPSVALQSTELIELLYSQLSYTLTFNP